MSVELESAKRLNALKAKADAKTGESSATLSDAVDKLIAGFGQGGGGDDPLQYATFINGAAFRQAVFPPNYHVKLNIAGNLNSAPSFNTLFFGCNAEKITVRITNAPETGFDATNSMFNGCNSLVEVDISQDTFKSKNTVSMFASCKTLKTIKGDIDISGANNISGMFEKAYALENVKFVPNSIPKTISFTDSSVLSTDSIQSIIDGLADLTGGTAQTLTLHADVKSKLTETQISAITGKNWTLA